MPAKKSTQKRSAVRPKKPSKNPAVSRPARLKARVAGLRARRPHHSFRLTRRRDYARPLDLPGHFRFTMQVLSELWVQWRTFALLIVLLVVLGLAFSSVVSQGTYRQVVDAVDSSLGDSANNSLGEVTKAGLLLSNAVGGAFSDSSTDAQQIYGTLITLLTWLVTIWLVRAHLAGNKLRLRDALYSSGSPIVATFLVGLVILVQLVPAAIGIIGYQTLVESGLASAGVLAMLVTLIAFLLVVISVYFLVSSLFALVIVTLPGMYPLRAIRASGDLVHGRRLTILFRLLWLAIFVVMIWAVLMLPLIIGTNALQSHVASIKSVPIVPIAVVAMSSLTMIFTATYIYMLYRRIVDDDSASA